MKEKYSKPELELLKLSEELVVSTSLPNGSGNDGEEPNADELA